MSLLSLLLLLLFYIFFLLFFFINLWRCVADRHRKNNNISLVWSTVKRVVHSRGDPIRLTDVQIQELTNCSVWPGPRDERASVAELGHGVRPLGGSQRHGARVRAVHGQWLSGVRVEPAAPRRTPVRSGLRPSLRTHPRYNHGGLLASKDKMTHFVHTITVICTCLLIICT